MSRRHALIIVALLCSFVAAAGCTSTEQMNPSFPLTVRDAETALREMRDNPKPLDRPVLIIGGWANTRMMTARLAGAFRAVAVDDVELEHVSMLSASSFEKCRERAIQAVDRAFGAGDDVPDTGKTIEVDVIGFSMGGLVARYAAAERTDSKRRLNIRRLFTIGTPHCGARMADLAPFERRASDMRCGSALLTLLNSHCPECSLDMYCYVRLGDMIVGAENAAPPGVHPWWVPNRPFEGAHHDAYRDPRIIADIARHLRGETPFIRLPAAPLPDSDNDIPLKRALGTTTEDSAEPPGAGAEKLHRAEYNRTD